MSLRKLFDMNLAWLLVLVAGVNSTIGNYLLKKSMTLYGDAGFISGILNFWFIGGMFFYGLNVLFFAKSLTVLPVSAAYPVLAGFGFLLLSFVGAFLLGEKLSGIQYIGIVTLLVGILIISFGGK